jgi:hypothetical protein
MTKPQIALMQITAALKAGVAPGVVLMDASYGTNAGLRFGIAALGLTYAGAIVPTVKVCAVAEPQERVSVKTLALRLPKHAWRTITWREGSAEKLTSRFARVRVRTARRARARVNWAFGGPPSPPALPVSDHRRAVRVLDLDPVPRGSGPIGRGEPFRHDALTQDGRQRCTVSAAASFLRSASCQLSAQGPDRRAACVRASARAATRVCSLTYPAHAEGVDRDESPAPPRRRRHHRSDWSADHPRDPGGAFCAGQDIELFFRADAKDPGIMRRTHASTNWPAPGSRCRHGRPGRNRAVEARIREDAGSNRGSCELSQ